MNTSSPSAQINIRNRRGFLKGLGALGAASVLCGRTALAGSERHGSRLELFVEATVEDFTLLWPTPDLPPLQPGTILRVRMEFPVHRPNLLEWHTFVAAAAAPEQPLFVVTLFRMRVDHIALSRRPVPNFGLFGQVIDNPVVDNPNRSPFGDLTGHILMIGGQFDAPGDNTTFTLLGGMAAGNHASALRTAIGSLRIRGPWH